MEFRSLDELYERVLPALSIKSKEYGGIVDVKDIWNYLAQNVWISVSDLTLAQIVDDILKCDVSKIKMVRGDVYDN